MFCLSHGPCASNVSLSLGNSGLDGERLVTKQQLRAAMANHEFRQGTDWVTPLGHPDLGILLHYGHPTCSWRVAARNPANAAVIASLGDAAAHTGAYPIRSGHWFLGCHEGRILRWEQAETSNSKINVNWHCPVCFDKYEQGAMNPARVVAFGADDNCREVFAARIGNITTTQENELTYLKGCSLAQKIGNGPITSASILRAIRMLNDTAERKLGSLQCAKLVYSADPQHHDRYTSHKIVCKDSELSLPTVGVPIKVMLYDQRALPELSSQEVDFVLAFCANFINLDSNFHDVGPAGRKAYWQLRDLAARHQPAVRLALTDGTP